MRTVLFLYAAADRARATSGPAIARLGVEVVMTVNEVMTKDVKTCRPETPLANVADLMCRLDLSSIPVVDSGDRLIGQITQRDLCRVLVKPAVDVQRSTARDVMQSDYQLCAPNDDVRSLLRLMSDNQLHEVSVVNQQGVLYGVLSLSDLILNAKHNATGSQPSDFEVMSAMRTISSRRCSAQRLREKSMCTVK